MPNQVFQGIDEVMKASRVKNAALQYLSQKITPSNFDGLQKTLMD